MEWIDIIVKIVFLVLGGVVTIYVVPWLKDKGLYDTVKRMVQGAEKWAENNDIDKREWVICKLNEHGVKVDSHVLALIESACEELDLAWARIEAAVDDE
jgi:hypothetical protein